MQKIMLLRPKPVNNVNYEATITFPNENVPELTPQLHAYVARGWAQYIDSDKVIEIPADISDNVGKVILPPLPVEEKKPIVKAEEYPTLEDKNPKEEKMYKSNYKSVGKKGK